MNLGFPLPNSSNHPNRTDMAFTKPGYLIEYPNKTKKTQPLTIHNKPNWLKPLKETDVRRSKRTVPEQEITHDPWLQWIKFKKRK